MIAINTKHMRNNMYCNIYCTNIAHCSNIKYFLPRERFWICVRIGSNPIMVKTSLTLYNMIDIIFLLNEIAYSSSVHFPLKKKPDHFPLLSLSPSYLFIKVMADYWFEIPIPIIFRPRILFYIFLCIHIKYEIY